MTKHLEEKSSLNRRIKKYRKEMKCVAYKVKVGLQKWKQISTLSLTQKLLASQINRKQVETKIIYSWTE